MAKKVDELTPMMRQFRELKAKHPDALLLFRCGDFYETYCDDAEVAAKILHITLTHRNKGAAQGEAMAGFPYHALDTHLPKLIRAGQRVAICDQLEDPKKTKTLVKRGITELVTPGVAMQDNVLENKENNFLCAVHLGRNAVGIAFLDISTGEFLCGEGSYDYAVKAIDNFQPKEVLYERRRRQEFLSRFPAKLCTYELDDWAFSEDTAEKSLCSHFSVKSLKGFGIDHMHNGIAAAGAVMGYLEFTEHKMLGHITGISRLDTDSFVRLDTFTVRSLELLNPMTDGGVSLLSVIDNTATAMGGRLMRRWLLFPLKDVGKIAARQNVVEHFFCSPALRETVSEQLQRIADLERITAKISTLRVNPREMRSLAEALHAVEILQKECAGSGNGDLMNIAAELDPCREMRDRICREISPEPPLLVSKGGVIGEGVDPELDDLRLLHRDSKDYLLQLQQQEAERTGISSLKVGFNNVFGYYLEVRNTYRDNVPATWVRKQTLAQAERYITPELKAYEEKILNAETRIMEIEQRIYDRLLRDCHGIVVTVQRNAALVARLDCLLSFALVSLRNRYSRPVMDDTPRLSIKAGRHPVIEARMEYGEKYIPNDILLDTGSQQIMMITGPNMAGKSALLRQTALIVLLAQTGCFVPAESAEIGIVDKVFTRVGASDNIAAGESTFMVEMTEAANILNNITDRSLVIFDELGRGTSTYDGISIAWAIVEYLHGSRERQSSPRPRTLFATHYHELNEMASRFPRIRNYSISVAEEEGRVVFLRKLVPGGSEHSFGIHVAEMAGMPGEIVRRANIILGELENKGGKDKKFLSQTERPSGTAAGRTPSSSKETGVVSEPLMSGDGFFSSAKQEERNSELSFFRLDDPVLEQIRDALLSLDVDNLTPLQALNKLNEIKGILGS
ncbi:MAG: DNA mismatch repair protein MutS [Bacteroidales bacterium]|nr:DNA mismatch repair protein MutS [Bacteroidales bacterium]MCM1146665.1 DNA mismatch repair protein MutS [Bacteroidales bacterium]MCM1206055.1 DNA mismatch repair protein MutS [Bacillota bacterium]MCM1511042.1 DNA mismatch repair protein MutS [Clostridium sp.]